MTTRAVGGSTATGLTAVPSWAIGTSGAAWSILIGGSWTITDARTAATVETTDLGPVMVTSSGTTVVSPGVRAAGRVPCSTRTGTFFSITSSSWTVVSDGS